MMNLDTTQIGLVFLVNAALYALVSPLAGWIGDKTVSIYNTHGALNVAQLHSYPRGKLKKHQGRHFSSLSQMSREAGDEK